MVQDLATYFYIYNILVASPCPDRLQSLFELLTNLFDWVSLYMKRRKTVRMAFHPLYKIVEILEATYDICMTGVGTSYRERLR